MKDEWKKALQQAKEIIGSFADGSDTPEANQAKALWTLLDSLQQSNL